MWPFKKKQVSTEIKMKVLDVVRQLMTDVSPDEEVTVTLKMDKDLVDKDEKLKKIFNLK